MVASTTAALPSRASIFSLSRGALGNGGDRGQDIATLKIGEHFGYPVDAGTGSFVDPETAAVASRCMASDEDLAQRWIDLGDKGGSGKDAPNFYANIDIGPGNIVMFQSGWGDGLYASWFGYDAQGRVVALLTNFNVVDWSKAQW